MRLAIVVHGGAGCISSLAESGCRRAAEIGMTILRQGGSALDAAVTAAKWMEDSAQFNAGSGSVQRVDGSINMDAAVATSGGRLATVAAVPGVRNPVVFAYILATRTQLVSMGGEDARRFAIEQLGLSAHPGPTPRVQKRHAEMMRDIEAGKLIPPGWVVTDDEGESAGVSKPGDDGAFARSSRIHDTIGVLTLDERGAFAVASSTGGSGAMIPGRIGDVPHRGAGFQIGEGGAVAATGIGEEILRRQGSDRVFEFMRAGIDPQNACQQVATALFPADIDVGF